MACRAASAVVISCYQQKLFLRRKKGSPLICPVFSLRICMLHDKELKYKQRIIRFSRISPDSGEQPRGYRAVTIASLQTQSVVAFSSNWLLFTTNPLASWCCGDRDVIKQADQGTICFSSWYIDRVLIITWFLATEL